MINWNHVFELLWFSILQKVVDMWIHNCSCDCRNLYCRNAQYCNLKPTLELQYINMF
jgi:hypothetical protein